MSVEIGNLELKGIIRRRKKVFLWSFALIFLACGIIAFVLPSVYESEVMIVVENQEIPDEFVKSTITTFVSERLHILRKKILSHQKLKEIIAEFQLYPELSTEGDKVPAMRDDIQLETIDVSVGDRGSSQRGKATIAFTLTYKYEDPELAKKVADTLASLFVFEDQKRRLEQASNTTKFLEAELENLRKVVQEHEEKISRFKAANIKQLPGSTGVFSQTIFRLEQSIDNIDTRIRTNQEKIVYLKSQISNIDPLVPIMTDSGKVANNPNNRLKALRLQLIRKQAVLSEKHPDIIRMKSEIEKLESQVGQSETRADLENQLTILNQEIAKLKATYDDNHPDVVRLSKQADLLQRRIADSPSVETIDENQSDNPGYMNIKAQIIVAETEIEALRAERLKQQMKLEDYQRRLESAPFVDEEYNALTLDYANAKKKFNEVSNKLHSAKLSQEMDTTEKGVRFRIDYPANLPGKPTEPNRILILLMGIVLGVGTGILLAAVTEGLDSSVKVADDLEALAGVPVLATVSFIDSPKQKRMRRIKQLMVVATVVVSILFVSLMINWFVVPMEDLWAKFEDRLVEVGVPIERNSETM